MSPSKFQTLLREAVALHRSQQFAAAERLYRQLRAVQPKHFDVVQLLGLVAYQQGRSDEAVELLTRAHQLDRKSVVCEMRLGLALIAARQLPEAEAHLRAVVARSPEFHEGWDNLAYGLKTQDRLPEAVECHCRVVALKPDYPTGWYNYGHTLNLLGRTDEALACHERALALQPDYPHALLGRAQALHKGDRLAEAIEGYGRLIALKPAHFEARSCRLYALHNLDGCTREQLFAEHVAFGRVVESSIQPPAEEARPAPLADPERRLRLAILSPDLREHSCAYFLEPLLRHLDRAQWELFLYHDHFRADAVSARFEALADRWRNFFGVDNSAVERTIRDDAPDILIDLAGHTGAAHRLPLFAGRLAPVQVTYLGYPNTTGLQAMDYRFTDEIADPTGDADALATETLVRFAPTAWCYAPPAGTPAVAALPAAAGGGVTFGCFNTPAKITDAQLREWAQLLAEVPRSRLLLKGAGLEDDAVAARYRERLARCGVPTERVELLGRTPDTASHLACYHRVDVALDTFPYHGTTTTCEALWMGVPVISRRGDRHVARVGASLLTAAGHPEWIAADAADYRRRAVALAGDPTGLVTIRAALRAEMARGPLLDHAGQARCWSAALCAGWRRWCATRPDGVREPELVASG